MSEKSDVLGVKRSKSRFIHNVDIIESVASVFISLVVGNEVFYKLNRHCWIGFSVHSFDVFSAFCLIALGLLLFEVLFMILIFLFQRFSLLFDCHRATKFTAENILEPSLMFEFSLLLDWRLFDWLDFLFNCFLHWLLSHNFTWKPIVRKHPWLAGDRVAWFYWRIWRFMAKNPPAAVLRRWLMLWLIDCIQWFVFWLQCVWLSDWRIRFILIGWFGKWFATIEDYMFALLR